MQVNGGERYFRDYNLTIINFIEWHFIGQRHIEIKDFEGIFEKSADKNSVKIFLGDNRGTKIKR